MSEHNPEIKLYVFVSIYQSDPPELVYAENVEQARVLLNEKYNPFVEYREPKVFDIPVSPTLIDYHQGE